MWYSYCIMNTEQICKNIFTENVLISEKLHSDIMGFQLQQMYSYEVFGWWCLYHKKGLRKQLQLQYNTELTS